MKLEKFKERNNKQKYIIIFTIACVLFITGVFLYKTFASFQVIENEDLINGNVSDPGDVYFAFYVDGVLSKEVPQKGSNYVFNSKESYCGKLGKKNDNIIPWYHREDGSITVEGILNTHTKCVLYFERGENFIETIQKVPIKEEESNEEGLYKVSHTDADITYTEDEEKKNELKKEELRYAGSNPDNYVWFNHELWRVIGLVNTPEGQRIKLRRKDSIGSYAWDTSEKEINQGYGVNEWSTSDIQVLLNDYYYQNKINQTCYTTQENQSTICSFDGKDGHVRGLKQVDEMIDTITWNVGTVSKTNLLTKEFYDEERGKLVTTCTDPINCNDNIPRSYLWRGNVGLIYPSDFAYGIGKNRQSCLNVLLHTWRNNTTCQNNNWQFTSSSYWTIAPETYPIYAYQVVIVSDITDASYTSKNTPSPVYPTLYLKTDILVSQNSTGTVDNPFMI